MKTNEKQELNIYKNKHYLCKVHFHHAIQEQLTLNSVRGNTSLFFHESHISIVIKCCTSG